MFTLGWRLYMRDPVPWAMAAVWIIYVASIAILFPDYLHVMFPLIFNYYVNGGQTVWQTILVPRMGTALVLLAPLAVDRLSKQECSLENIEPRRDGCGGLRPCSA